MQPQPAIFEEHEIRRVYDETMETWWFSVVDMVQVLTQQPDYQAARNYWKVLKNRLSKEGSESVTKCNRLKLPAADGKNYLSAQSRIAANYDLCAGYAARGLRRGVPPSVTVIASQCA